MLNKVPTGLLNLAFAWYMLNEKELVETYAESKCVKLNANIWRNFKRTCMYYTLYRIRYPDYAVPIEFSYIQEVLTNILVKSYYITN